MDLQAPYTTLEAFLDHWDGVRMVTLNLLECFSPDDLFYRPVPGWRTVGEQFHHLGSHQYFVARGVLLRRWTPLPGEPDADWDAHQAAVAHSVPALRAWLTDLQVKVRQWAALAAESALTDFRPDNPWHEGIRGWLLLHHPYQDELHHRGQLYAVARLLGRTPPEVFAEEYPDYWTPRKGK
jgi:uncharacterized damage-inducible protein DinB